MRNSGMTCQSPLIQLPEKTCSTSDLVSNEISFKSDSHLRVHLYMLVLGIPFMRKLTGKKSCNTTKHWQKHFELKTSIPYFAFNEVSLMSKNYLRVVLHLLSGIWGLKVIWKNRAPVLWLLSIFPLSFFKYFRLSIVIV